MPFEKELRTNNQYMTEAYYRGRWVAVPLFYIPLEAIDKDGNAHRFQVTLLDEPKKTKATRKKSRKKPHENKNLRMIKETLLPWNMPTKELKDLCSKSDIPEYWVAGRKKPRKNSDGHTRRTDRKYHLLTHTEYKKFIRQLKNMSEKCTLIAEILWFLNHELKLGSDYITLAEVVRLRVEDLDLEDDLFPCIRLYRESHLVVHFLPDYIYEPLRSLIKSDSGYVFSNANGGPFLTSDVDKYFKVAGQRARIKSGVSSLSLRPPGIPSELEEVSEQEWKLLSSEIPGLDGRKGRPSKHHPKDIFNAILYLKRTKTPLRKLPSEYPDWTAVDSQSRRWKENGIYDQLMKFRRKKTKS